MLTSHWSEENESLGYDEINCTAFEAEVLTGKTDVSNAIWAAVSTSLAQGAALWLAE
jgi:hypothetical protein